MSGLPLILSFNTATPGGSVCLVQGDEVRASIFGNPSVSHSSTLLSDIAATLKTAGVSLPEVQLLAAAAGPGSFTGLRIGIATIKALSTTLKRPCFGIPTLRAIAHSAGPSEATVAVLPAGRGEVFAQLFSVSSAGEVMDLDQPAHLPPFALLEKYGMRRNLEWAGQCVLNHREMIEEYAARRAIELVDWPQDREGLILATGEGNLAKDIAALAFDRYQRGQSDTAETLEAIYVRPSDAELKRNASH